ncbi:serine protease [Bradyrhizobium sp. BR 10261]|uniref:serine protease n=1 Tax=Bradyrhizobium sp. BR 10261 TaxID=2749992 RepID=UPI001C64CE0B|nr:serine protease [Bradyrhizobium sp. BR 10261]MBW7964731.1 peptidoglycan-binding protein [Bradyrhizobium sp. BR 10261]
MRSMLAATLMLASATGAGAQMTTPPIPGTKPKVVQTVPIKPPALQTPSETADAMVQAERLALQSDLAWVGQYNGAITGDVSSRMVDAIKEYQKAKGGKPTGVLNPQERAALAETARRKQDSVGWKIVTETTSGARLGIPSKLVPNQATDANGSKWSSPTGTVQVLLNRRKEANPTTAKLAETEKKEPAGRKVDYTVVKPDFFVLSGLQGLKKFYVRGTFKGDEVRIMTILYDQAMENTVEPVVIAMSSAFNAFPSRPQAGPPPRKTVEYGTGIVVSDGGAILADRLVTDACLAITIGGYGSADRLAEDKEHDLALLHIYGARGLKPLSLTGGAAKTGVDVVGIADPQSQGGAAGVSSVKGTLTPVTSSDSALSPPPAVGFSGGAAIDGEGKFVGVALSKPAMVAGPATSMPTSQAVMVSAETVRDFLKANAVTANGTSTDAKAAVVRVICVRK